MKYLFKGILVSLGFAVISFVLSAIGDFIGLKSLWWPCYWPDVAFNSVGHPVVYLLDHVPIINKTASLIFPEGGASGIFGLIFITSFLVWTTVFTLFYKIKSSPNKRFKSDAGRVRWKACGQEINSVT